MLPDNMYMTWPIALNRLATGMVEAVMYWDGENNIYTYDDGKILLTFKGSGYSVLCAPCTDEMFKAINLEELC